MLCAFLLNTQYSIFVQQLFWSVESCITQVEWQFASSVLEHYNFDHTVCRRMSLYSERPHIRHRRCYRTSSVWPQWKFSEWQLVASCQSASTPGKLSADVHSRFTPSGFSEVAGWMTSIALQHVYKSVILSSVRVNVCSNSKNVRVMFRLDFEKNVTTLKTHVCIFSKVS